MLYICRVSIALRDDLRKFKIFPWRFVAGRGFAFNFDMWILSLPSERPTSGANLTSFLCHATCRTHKSLMTHALSRSPSPPLSLSRSFSLFPKKQAYGRQAKF